MPYADIIRPLDSLILWVLTPEPLATSHLRALVSSAGLAPEFMTQ
jgi:hypothetical protein